MIGVPTSPSSPLDDLAWRGLIQDSTNLDELRVHLDSGYRRFYVGFDPTAPSLTIGNLLAMSLVMRGARAGLGPVVLFGGGTGLIGDPSGKTAERCLLPIQEATDNVARHQALMTKIFERALTPEQITEFVDHADWLTTINALDFLRNVASTFRCPRCPPRHRPPTARESCGRADLHGVQLRAATGIRLHAAVRDVTLQMGASDQWGNIVAGIDYVRRTLRTPVHGLTCPLPLRADGTKFGKTEKGAVWITADRTSPYTLYQILINLSDDEVRKFALFFSFEDRDTLEKLFAEHAEQPVRRILQPHMGREITTLPHGEDACDEAVAASEGLDATG